VEEAGGWHIEKVKLGGIVRRVCLDFVPEAANGDYSIFGIAVDRSHALKWFFPQEKVAFHGSQKVYVYSENALNDGSYRSCD
jgi:hypothetical protein